MRMAGPGGRVMHAELQIGDSRFMIGDEFPGMSVAPAPSTLHSYSLLSIPTMWTALLIAP